MTTCQIIDADAEQPHGVPAHGTLAAEFENEVVDLDVCGSHAHVFPGVFTPSERLTQPASWTSAIGRDQRYETAEEALGYPPEHSDHHIYDQTTECPRCEWNIDHLAGAD